MSGILKKLDRVMGNGEFIRSYVEAHAIFKPYRLSDHCPAILKIPLVKRFKPKLFKLANFLVKNKEFLPMVKDVWKENVVGHNMFRVVQKLKSVKKCSRKMMWKASNLHERVTVLRKELDEIQLSVDRDPDNQELRAD